MKTTIVPAQVTTVEDTIVGNLTLIQLILMSAPVFSSGAVYVILPPFLKLTLYKFILSVVIALPPIVLSLRFQGQIAFRLIRLALAYLIRPRIYLLLPSLNSCYFCSEQIEEIEEKTEKKPEIIDQVKPLNNTELRELGEVLTDRTINFYANKKGGFNAVVE